MTESITGFGPVKNIKWHQSAIDLWNGDLHGRTMSIAVRIGIPNRLVRQMLQERGIILREDCCIMDGEGLAGTI